MLDAVFLNGVDSQPLNGNIAAVVVDTVAAHVGHRHILTHDTAAIGLEAVLCHILDGHIVQLHKATGISLNRSGRYVLDGAIVEVQFTTKGVHAVLLTVGAFDGHIVQHCLAVAHGDRLVTTNAQRCAIDGQITAGIGNIAVTASTDGQILEFHIAGEVVHRTSIALAGGEILGVDLAAVVGQTVNLTCIHGGALDIQVGTFIVHDAALPQLHCAGLQIAVVAQTVNTVGDVTAGDFRGCALGYHNTVLGSSFIGTAGHCQGTGCHIDIVQTGPGNGTTALGHSTGCVDHRTGLSAGYDTTGNVQLAVVDHIVCLSVKQTTTGNGSFSTLCHHQVGITAVLYACFAGNGQLGARLHQNAVGIAAGIDDDTFTQRQRKALAYHQSGCHGRSLLSLQLGATHAP